MPGLYVVLHDYLPSCFLSKTLLMSRRKEDDTLDAPRIVAINNNADGRTSILIFISARALGSMGFALSLLSIWFGWLLPTSAAPPAALEVLEKKPRLTPRFPRRPPLSHTPKPVAIRRASAPVDLTPILNSQSSENSPTLTRRVYFVGDVPPPPITRRNTMPESAAPHLGLVGSQKIVGSVLGSVTGSPRSSSSTLPNTPPDGPLTSFNGVDERVVESDSSRPSSRNSMTKNSSRLQKFKFGFNKPAPIPIPNENEKPSDQASIVSMESNTSDKSGKRTSGPPCSWLTSRARTTTDVTTELATPSPSRLSFSRRMSPARPSTAAPGSSTPSSVAEILSPTFLNRKRVSAPIPRTSPYGAPYFATPPMLLDNSYPAYLKGLPQFEDEVQLSSSRASDSDDADRARGRERSIKRVSLNSPPRKYVPKQRSASEDWTNKPALET